MKALQGVYLTFDTPKGAFSENHMRRIYMGAFHFFYAIFCGVSINSYGSNHNFTHFYPKA